MEIQSTSFNVFFPKMTNLRQKFFDFEEKLQLQFSKPMTLVPIPDEAPEEIPRITAVSKEGHSSLNVSLNQLSLQTTYDERYNNNWSQCSTYVRERAFPLLDVMEGLVGNEFLFSGLTTQVYFVDIGKDVINHFTEKFIKVNSTSAPFDVNLKITYIVDDFHINFTLSNYRVYEGTGNPQILSPAYLEQTSEGIGVVVDINDRYGFNHKKEYRSSREKVTRILSLTDEIIETKIKELVYNGGVSL